MEYVGEEDRVLKQHEGSRRNLPNYYCSLIMNGIVRPHRAHAAEGK